MKDIISNILDIENKANSIIEEGKEEIIRLRQKLKDDTDKMQKDINAMVELKLKQLDEDEKSSADKNLLRINETAEKRLSVMDEFYKENRDFWVQAVFEIVTGSEKSGS